MSFTRSPSVARISKFCTTTGSFTHETRIAPILSIARHGHYDRAFSSSSALRYTATSHALNLKDFQEHWAKQSDIWVSRARPPSDRRPIDVKPPSSKHSTAKTSSITMTPRSKPTTPTPKTSTITTVPRSNPTTLGPRRSFLSATRPPFYSQFYPRYKSNGERTFLTATIDLAINIFGEILILFLFFIPLSIGFYNFSDRIFGISEEERLKREALAMRIAEIQQARGVDNSGARPQSEHRAAWWTFRGIKDQWEEGRAIQDEIFRSRRGRVMDFDERETRRRE